MEAVVRQLPMEHTVLNTVRISLLANDAIDCGHLQVSLSCQPVQQAVEVIRGEVKGSLLAKYDLESIDHQNTTRVLASLVSA